MAWSLRTARRSRCPAPLDPEPPMSEDLTPAEASDGNQVERDLTIPEALALAVELHRDRRLTEAEKLYRAVLEAVPEHPDALNFLGVLSNQQGNPAEGERLIRRSLDLAPEHPDALNNLGNVLKGAGRLTEAEAAYRRVLEVRPDHVGALNNLGVVLKDQKRLEEAIATLQRAVGLWPEYADAHYNLGNALKRSGRLREGIESYCRAISLDPRQAHSRKVLAYSLYLLGRKNEAVSVLDDWLALEPDHPVAVHLRAACSGEGVPDRASDRFIRQVFDEFAASFDARLKGLEYRAPELVAEAVSKAVGEPSAVLDVLDAGCGTGLCGPLLRPYARSLTGVDLSPAMAGKARERGVYDDVVVSELTEFLSDVREAYHLVVSADTLVYFGALDKVLAAAAGAMRPLGWLAFTLEREKDKSAPAGFVLQHHGRYTHTEGYIRSCGAAARLQVCSLDRAELRMEAGFPVDGWVVLMRKADGEPVSS